MNEAIPVSQPVMNTALSRSKIPFFGFDKPSTYQATKPMDTTPANRQAANMSQTVPFATSSLIGGKNG